MNKVLLKNSIKDLKKIQAHLELHDDIGSSTRMELKQAISQLELYALKESAEMKQIEILQLIGKFVAAIPAIAKLIETIVQH